MEQLKKEIKDYQTLIKTMEDGSVDVGTATINDLKRKEFELKKKAVLSIHKNKIYSMVINDRGKERIKWQTNYNGKKSKKFNTEEELIDFLYNLYFDSSYTTDYSFKNIFEMSLKDREFRNTLSSETVKRYKYDYNAFLTDLNDVDIRTVETKDLDDYLLNLADLFRKENRTEKFANIKTLLNMVFDYAIENKMIIHSPVPKGTRTYKKKIASRKPTPQEKAFQPNEVELIRNKCLERIKRYEYDINAYAILFSSYSGVREGEIPSLKWSDIDFNTREIHIHSQQLKKNGKLYYEPSTKDEKGISNDGRYFPMYNSIYSLLMELKNKQEKLGIQSEYVFARKDGRWLHKDTYASSLRKLCQGDPTKGTTGLGLKLCNNHAFRIALNSYVFIPKGIDVMERAKLLGHSPKVNAENYSFSEADKHLERLRYVLDDADPCRPNIIEFEAKRKSLETTNFKAL